MDLDAGEEVGMPDLPDGDRDMDSTWDYYHDKASVWKGWGPRNGLELHTDGAT